MLVRFVTEVFLISLSVLFTIILYYPVLLPVFLGLLSYRKIVILVAKIWHKSWLPAGIFSGFIATDMLNSSKTRNISITCEFEKPFDHVKLRERVKLFLYKNEHPELKSHFVRWMGIHFLKPCSTFEFDSVFSVNPTRSSEVSDSGENINRLAKDFSSQPFKPCHPLWQVMIFPNVKANKVVLTIRAHHGLLDAISVMRLLQELADPISEDAVQAKISTLMKKYLPPLPLYSKVLIGLDLLMVAPPQCFYTFLKSINVNMWTSSGNSGKLIYHQQKFCSERIKRISTRLGRNGNTIFSAALIGAIREEMRARGDSVDQDVTLNYILPSPKHASQTLGNYGVGSFAVIPISLDGVKQRLERIEDMFRQMRRPAWVLQCDLASNFAALLTSLMGSGKKPEFLGSGGWTNVSSFELETKLKFFGKMASNFLLDLGLQMEGLPIAFATVKFKDEVLLYVNTYESLFPVKNGLEIFFKRFENELVKLEAM